MNGTNIAHTNTITQEQQDVLAERIAVVLRERKKIGAQRRIPDGPIQERKLQRHNSEEIKDDFASALAAFRLAMNRGRPPKPD
jgi:hypothetical protein